MSAVSTNPKRGAAEFAKIIGHADLRILILELILLLFCLFLGLKRLPTPSAAAIPCP